MTENTIGQVWIERRQRLEHFRSTARMGHDGPTLVGTELARLVDDVGQRTIHFTDVMKERNTLDTSLHPFVHISSLCQNECELGDSADVRAGGGVIGVDRIEDRLEGRGAKPLQPPFCASLSQVHHADRGDKQNRRIS